MIPLTPKLFTKNFCKRFASSTVVFLIFMPQLIEFTDKGLCCPQGIFILIHGSLLKMPSSHMHTVIMHNGEINIIYAIIIQNHYCRRVWEITIMKQLNGMKHIYQWRKSFFASRRTYYWFITNTS